ncbi:galactose/methyl galactoside import ATP-binding protein MglA [Treponema primitia ZAS-2]|uniref:Ribose/galactose/methyl galactoside import ATP-binding protein n=1 Tax=Treponema primitia (strain ATCC BAA-887 / DSM 12427 / ZAS-2) TaxID=545694 RepID=F5YJF8_TREPZ|nr:sugar ABC transporter ATP-binding protein [Treponema primitia]AEF85805.1 galactose/methyl galactoside import ATP-binding protein MglA [Treponema primitia ZAS-2]
MENANYVLQVNELSKSFPGVRALDKVSINVRPGSVHALMGENGAGKSTLMKCLFGIYEPDSGEIVLEGKSVHFDDSRQALDAGISMIHQELLPVPFRSVMENLWLGRYPQHSVGFIKLVDHKKMYQDTVDLFKDLNMEIDPKIWVRELSVSKVQSLEIAKAVSWHSKVIIMDEPTSSLTENEVEQLFAIIRRLRNEGVAIIYISHKIEEILTISDDVSIMRDGKHIGTYSSGELTTDKIIKYMVGRDLSNRFPPKDNTPGELIMEVKNLTSAIDHSFKDVSFSVRRGEILGIGGLVGAQRTELVESLFGLRTIEGGQVFINGSEVSIKSPTQAKGHKLALLTEERRATGIVPMLSVKDNMILANLKSYVGSTLLINDKQGETDATENIKALNIKTPGSKTLIRDLSGGNQQKVLFARWLLTEPDILILDEPTRGIDVSAKYEIYSIILGLAKQGKSIIMISSEMPELLGISDRIMVMCAGRVTGILDRKDATQEEIMRLATKFM